MKELRLVINEKFGVRNSVSDGLYRFVVVSFKETTTNREEPLLLVDVKLDDGNKFTIPLLLTEDNTGRLCEFFCSIGLKKRGVPVLYETVRDSMVGKQGHVLIINNVPVKFLNLGDLYYGELCGLL